MSMWRFSRHIRGLQKIKKCCENIQDNRTNFFVYKKVKSVNGLYILDTLFFAPQCVGDLTGYGGFFQSGLHSFKCPSGHLKLQAVLMLIKMLKKEIVKDGLLVNFFFSPVLKRIVVLCFFQFLSKSTKNLKTLLKNLSVEK